MICPSLRILRSNLISFQTECCLPLLTRLFEIFVQTYRKRNAPALRFVPREMIVSAREWINTKEPAGKETKFTDARLI